MVTRAQERGMGTEILVRSGRNLRRTRLLRRIGVSESLTAMPVMDGFSFTDLFPELGIDQEYRIAWVELNPDAFKTVSFIETALHNRGLPGRLFPTEAEPREWLLEREGA